MARSMMSKACSCHQIGLNEGLPPENYQKPSRVAERVDTGNTVGCQVSVPEAKRHGSARITMVVYAPDVAQAQVQRKVVRDAAGEEREDELKVVWSRCVPGEKRGSRQVSYFVGVPLP
jgi:hypothetical protein